MFATKKQLKQLCDILGISFDGRDVGAYKNMDGGNLDLKPVTRKRHVDELNSLLEIINALYSHLGLDYEENKTIVIKTK